ncbi:YjjG family noncanonical pyrimidine nucleotidase [Levilactobacillus namurensis]|uniref:YjjG family noncanonical pyrimidine nucleotidase n=1 Tax=Levilactobacillus namurensis TaxID=380393 RepID=A0AAW8W7K4_9LACO|nr:YjjG family noncanonical pyrimidine nucleotidase [Levilactobacillus namurensis]MDT7014389.1 YjjG family noncanonical pyrimidine nucleotidase [Levilactobacillus namurensis]
MDFPILLFDLDQTLFDTDTNAQNALRKLALPFNFAFNDQQVAYWHRLQQIMWADFEQQKLTRETLINTRFERYFAHYGITVDGPTYERAFQQQFFAEHALMPHAQDVLARLKAAHYQLAVISNGTRAKQDRQLADSHLDQYFDQVFLSEDLHASKPDRQFFTQVQAGWPQATTTDYLVIGDSLSADIQGANNAQFASVWYNPHQLPNTSHATPTYQITTLPELIDLLK